MFDAWGPSRYEKIIFDCVPNEALATRLAGVARSIRISHESRSLEESVVISVASGLVAPLVFMYVWWLLSCARENGVKRIYFMARDGHIFMKAALKLIEQWNLDIEVRYLYCSRESLLLPSYETTGDFEKHWITWGYVSSICISEICRRLAMTVEEINPFLASSNLSTYCECPERPIARSDLPILHDMLRNKAFEKLVRSKSEPVFNATLSYLEQELLFDGVSSVIADTGWRGSSQYALSALMQKGGKRPSSGLTGYYLGLNREVHLFKNDTMHAFLFDWRHAPRDYRLYYFLCFEMLFSADHGKTLRYHDVAGSVVPVLADAPGEYIRNLAKYHHQKTVDYASRAAENILFEEFFDSLAEVSRKLAKAFICSPSRDEASVYGECPLASEIGEGDLQTMAPPMGFSQFVKCTIGKERVKGFWPQASLVRGRLPLLCKAYNCFLDLRLLDWYRRLVLRY